MATVVESLLVGLGFRADTSGANQFMGAMDGVVGKAMAVAAALGGILGAGSLAEASDEVTLMSDRLKDLTGSAESAAEMQDKIYESAQRIGTSQMDMSQAAARALPALKDMGKGVDEAIKMSEVLMVTARLNGSSVQEAASTAQQFSQALGSGTLAGDELKSILENNSTLARTLADELGVTVGALKDLGADGKISSKLMADSVLKAYDRVMARSKDLTDTFGMMKIRFKNWFQYVVDRMNKSGVFQPFINGIGNIFNELEKLKDSGQVEKFAKDLGEWIDYCEHRINSIRKSVKKWADDLGITEKAVTLLKVAVGYLGTALAGLTAITAFRAIVGSMMLLLNPFVLIGAAIGAVLLLIDDFMGYSEGRPSFIGKLIDDYPVIQKIIDALQLFGAAMGNIFNDNADGFSELGTAFGGLFTAIQPVITGIINILPTLINLIGFAISLLVGGTNDSVGVLTTLVNIIGFIVEGFGEWATSVGETVGAGVMWFDRMVEAIKSVGVWFDNLKQKFAEGLSAIELPSFKMPSFEMPSMPSLASLGAKLGMGSGGNSTTTINNNTSITVPTAAAAGQAANQVNNSAAKNASSNAKSAVHQ